MTEEFFDVVNENDEVIGKESRKHVHDNHLIHRAVTIFVFNSEGNIFMVQRSRNKDLNPLMWQGSASGHVESGETYDQAAERELKEELNIDAVLEFLFKVKVFSDSQKEFFQLYKVQTDDEITTNDEFEQSLFIDPKEILEEINKEPTKYRDAFVIMFKRFMKASNNP